MHKGADPGSVSMGLYHFWRVALLYHSQWAITIYTEWETSKCFLGEIGALMFLCCCSGLKFHGVRMAAMNAQLRSDNGQESRCTVFGNFTGLSPSMISRCTPFALILPRTIWRSFKNILLS